MSFKEIHIKTTNRTEMIEITGVIDKFVRDSMGNGIVVVCSPHTTAGITINENADPSVKSDMIKTLNKLIPYRDSYTHLEGNSDAHIKTTLTGLSVTIPVINGKMILGTWQGVFFCEYDGPRNRKFNIKSIDG
ncbi:MAG: YjbQ family protein [Spirochaetaceae bacterium]|nr:YjbQ family protein [Spirochaetaceae bacterium]